MVIAFAIALAVAEFSYDPFRECNCSRSSIRERESSGERDDHGCMAAMAGALAIAFAIAFERSCDRLSSVTCGCYSTYSCVYNTGG